MQKGFQDLIKVEANLNRINQGIKECILKRVKADQGTIKNLKVWERHQILRVEDQRKVKAQNLEVFHTAEAIKLILTTQGFRVLSSSLQEMQLSLMQNWHRR